MKITKYFMCFLLITSGSFVKASQSDASYLQCSTPYASTEYPSEVCVYYTLMGEGGSSGSRLCAAEDVVLQDMKEKNCSGVKDMEALISQLQLDQGMTVEDLSEIAEILEADQGEDSSRASGFSWKEMFLFISILTSKR